MSRGMFWLCVLVLAFIAYVYHDQNHGKNPASPPVATSAPAPSPQPGKTPAPVRTPVIPPATPPPLPGPAGFLATCTNGARAEEAGDGNVYMTSQPSQGYECAFTVQRQATRIWMGVNATLYKDGQQVQKGGNNIPMTLTPGSSYRVVGGLNNGGFALQTNPTA